MEIHKDAQLAREINLALPCELTDEQRLSLLRKFVVEQFLSRGMVADFAIHVPVPEKGDDPRNVHAHVLLTMRMPGEGGLRRVKTREWNSEKMLAAWREAWADAQNRMLQENGHGTRVDHRSLVVQRKDALRRREKTLAVRLDRLPEVHVGPSATAAVRRRQLYRLVRRGLVAEFADEPADRHRAIHNVSRVSANARKFELIATRTSKQLASLRRRKARYDQQIGSPQEIAADRHMDFSHLLKRKRQVEWLIQELDKLFFALLGIRESQLTRCTTWSNRIGRPSFSSRINSRSRP